MAEKMKHVASIAALRGGKLLFGLRGDTGKWNMPGGHVEEGETLEEGAARELLEETGLKPMDGSIQRVGFCDVRQGLRVHTFICTVEGEPDASGDPDEEIYAFKWVDPKKLPEKIRENLHNKKDVTLQFLGVQEPDLDLIWDEDGAGDHEARRRIVQLLKKAVQGLWKNDYDEDGMPRAVYHPGESEPPDMPEALEAPEAMAAPEAPEPEPALLPKRNTSVFPAPEPSDLSYDEILNHADPGIRFHAARIGYGPQRGHLQRLVFDSHPKVRREAKKTIWHRIQTAGGHESDYWLNHESFTPEDLTFALRNADGGISFKIFDHPHYGKLPEHELAALDNDLLAPQAAASLKTPEAAAEVLKRGRYDAIRAMAENPHGDYSSQALDWMLGNSGDNQRERTSREILRSVAYSRRASDAHIRAAVDRIKSASPDDMWTLARDLPRLPADLHEELALRGDPHTRIKAVERHDTPEHILMAALKDHQGPWPFYGSPTPAKAALQHPRLPLEGQLLALENPDLRDALINERKAEIGIHPKAIMKILDMTQGHGDHVGRVLTWNQAGVNEDVAEHAARHQNSEVRRLIAARFLPKLSHEDRVALANDENEEVRNALLDNDSTGSGPSQWLTPEDRKAIAASTERKGVARRLFQNRRFHESIPVNERIELALTHPNPEIRGVYVGNLLHATHPDVDEAALAQQALQDPSDEVRYQAIRHSSVKAPELERFMAPETLTPRMAHAIAANENVTSGQLQRIANLDLTSDPELKTLVAERIARHQNTPTPVLDKLIADNEHDTDVVNAALENPAVNLETVRRIASDSKHKSQHIAKKVLAVHDPDTVFKQKVSFGLGTNKLRKIRDAVAAAGDKPQHKNNFRQFGVDLTPYTKPGTAFVDPEKLQEAIEKRPPLSYNVSEGEWDDAQRHNGENSKVFQLNLTTDIVSKLKAAGVYETFKSMQEASAMSGHPIHEDHGLGWVRYTQWGDPKGSTKCDYCNDGTVEPYDTEVDCESCGADGTVRENCTDCYGGKIDVECGTCEGSGEVDGDTCEHCDGNGQVEEECGTCNGTGEIDSECSRCDGSGQATITIDDDTCSNCDGEGRVKIRGGRGVSKDKDHFFIDEVQSDFGQDFGRTILTNTRLELIRRGEAQGLQGQELDNYVNERMSSAEEEAKKYPAEHTKKISEILFSGKHSNEILYEAFLQHLRDQGYSGSQLRVHSTDSKGPISLGRGDSMKWVDPKTNKRVDIDDTGRVIKPQHLTAEQVARFQAAGYKQVKDIPAHFLSTYENIPSKILGWGRYQYGNGPNEDGHTIGEKDLEHLNGAPVWGDALYKFELTEAPDWMDMFGEKLFETELGDWLGKATKADDFKSIAKATTSEGRMLVDHTPQMKAHPPDHSPMVEHYQQEILAGPKLYRKKSQGGGITRKLVYASTGSKNGEPVQVQDAGSKFMVKPYHERVIRRIQGWQKFPIQGWAEMTNQALYHAGGIGDLHQKVHVSEHNMGSGFEKEPALVVQLSPGFKPVQEAWNTYEGPAPDHWPRPPELPADQPHITKYRKPIKIGPNLRADVRKIAVMDFLTNNLDRHHGNLTVSADGQRALAIDHSRSFQYVNNYGHKLHGRQRVKAINNFEDQFKHYIGRDTAIHTVDPLQTGYNDRMRHMEEYSPTFEWWGENGDKIRSAMYEQLKAIKDPLVAAHIRRNFDERAKWLDERARFGIENYGDDWHTYPVQQYHPHQKTDEERQEEDWRRRMAEEEAGK